MASVARPPISPRNHARSLCVQRLGYEAVVQRFLTALSVLIVAESPILGQSVSVYPAVTGQPFHAEVKWVKTQTLPDGKQIVQESRGVLARDSEGRVFSEQLPSQKIKATGGSYTFTRHTVSISDPVAMTVMQWNDETETNRDSKTVLKTALRPGPGGAKPPVLDACQRENGTTRSYPNGKTQKIDDLGERTIQGIPTHGCRVSTFIPAGAIARAKMTRSSGISLPRDQQDCGKAQKCRDDARRRVELVDISRQDDGLHKAAVANHGYYLESDDGSPWNRVFSLKELVHASTEVFVGTVRDSRSELEHHGRYIHTRYSVEIEQILKGSLRPGQTVSFLLPGGKVTFDDGAVAEVSKEKEPPLLMDHRYALFTLDSTEEAGLRPIGADEGVFELLLNASVHPHAYYSWDALQAAKQLTQEQFFAAVETAAQEEKRLTEK